MKYIQILLFFHATILASSCQEVRESHYRLKVEVTDESGEAVQGASVHTSRLQLGETMLSSKMENNPPVITDADGIAHVEYDSVHHASGGPSPGAFVEKDGWYPSRTRIGNWSLPKPEDTGIYSANCKVTLKKIRNPIPMAASRMNDERIIRISEYGKTYRFDLENVSMVARGEDGKHPDILFRIDKSPNESELTLTISFTNKGDGIVEFLTPQRTALHEPIKEGSVLISNYSAPVEGYAPILKRYWTILPNGSSPRTDSDPTRNFYFRTRTVLDDTGKIVSCHYGKIYGDFKFRSSVKESGFVASLVWEASYFNPSPNDRNVEFDPNRNLISDGNVSKP